MKPWRYVEGVLGADLHILAVRTRLFNSCSADVGVGRSVHVLAGVVVSLLQLCQLQIELTEASFI